MYYILKFIARMLVLLTTSCKVQGKENIPVKGPLVVVANHLSSGDPVLIGALLGRKIIFMAKEELFYNWFYSYFVRHFGAFPVYRGRSNSNALHQADQILKQEKVLGMFPEGKRSTEGSIMPALYGTALIAYHNRAPILPVGIIGTERIRGFSWIWHRPKVTLKIGPTFYLSDTRRVLTKEQMAEFTDIIMKHVVELLPEKYHGEYGRR